MLCSSPPGRSPCGCSCRFLKLKMATTLEWQSRLVTGDRGRSRRSVMLGYVAGPLWRLVSLMVSLYAPTGEGV